MGQSITDYTFAFYKAAAERGHKFTAVRHDPLQGGVYKGRETPSRLTIHHYIPGKTGQIKLTHAASVGYEIGDSQRRIEDIFEEEGIVLMAPNLFGRPTLTGEYLVVRYTDHSFAGIESTRENGVQRANPADTPGVTASFFYHPSPHGDDGLTRIVAYRGNAKLTETDTLLPLKDAFDLMLDLLEGKKNVGEVNSSVRERR